MALIWTALVRLPRPVWGSVAALAVLAFAYTLGARHKAAEIADQDREDFHETTERIDRATGAGGGVDAARGRLRDTFGPWPGDL